MISFEIVTKDNLDGVLARLSGEVADTELLCEIASSLVELTEEGMEVALSMTPGILLARIFDDGRYSFVYPILIDEDGDTEAALVALVDYARRELVPVYLTDVPREEIELITRLFDHVDARCYDDDEDSFVAVVNSECDLVDLPPVVTSGEVTLSPLVDADTAKYAALCRDREINKYWGFDDTADRPDAPDEYYIELAESELMRGVAMSLGVRYGGELVGEAVLFDFDYHGSAMAAIRLDSEHQGRGIGSSALTALIEAARKIGLKALRAEIMEENIPSIRMTEKQMDFISADSGIRRYKKAL